MKSTVAGIIRRIRRATATILTHVSPIHPFPIIIHAATAGTGEHRREFDGGKLWDNDLLFLKTYQRP